MYRAILGQEHGVSGQVPRRDCSALRSLRLGHKEHLQVDLLLEIGPHSALQAPVREILGAIQGAANVRYTPSLFRPQPALQSTISAIGILHCLGIRFDFESVNCYQGKRSKPRLILPDLPEYPFDYSHTYWHESRISRNNRFLQKPKRDLLGKSLSDWNPLEATFCESPRCPGLGITLSTAHSYTRPLVCLFWPSSWRARSLIQTEMCRGSV